MNYFTYGAPDKRPGATFIRIVFFAGLSAVVLLIPRIALAREIIPFTGYALGSIVIKTNERRLYYVISNDKAIRYPVGVGKAGMGWSGIVSIDGKYIRPAWAAPDSIRKDYARLPRVVPGGNAANPMGAAALTLSGGGEYAIHGTNNPSSVGHFVSHGCIRMYNEDIMDLYRHVSLGTKVEVLP